MQTWVWIAVVVVLAAAGVNAIRRTAAGRVDPTQLLLDPELVGRVRVLAQQGRTIEAIKTLRAGTPGLGLAAAKLMVERMATPSTPPGHPG